VRPLQRVPRRLLQRHRAVQRLVGLSNYYSSPHRHIHRYRHTTLEYLLSVRMSPYDVANARYLALRNGPDTMTARCAARTASPVETLPATRKPRVPTHASRARGSNTLTRSVPQRSLRSARSTETSLIKPFAWGATAMAHASNGARTARTLDAAPNARSSVTTPPPPAPPPPAPPPPAPPTQPKAWWAWKRSILWCGKVEQAKQCTRLSLRGRVCVKRPLLSVPLPVIHLESIRQPDFTKRCKSW